MKHLDDQLSAYLDGELHAEELSSVTAHLSRCEQCIAEFRSLREARAAVRLLPRMDLPVDVAASFGLETAHLGMLLSAFLDGEVTGVESRRVQGHIAACGECANELREMDAARAAVRAMPILDFVSPPLAEVIELPRRRTWVRAVAVAAALAAVIGIGGALAPTPDIEAATVDLEVLTVRHAARTSLDNGVAVIPAGLTGDNE